MKTKKQRTRRPRFRNRVVALRHVKASEINPHPKNWRRYPAFQRRALDELLARIGFAGALLVRIDDEGRYVLIDGHLRKERAGDEAVPVVVTDLTEAEAELLLATYDPLSALAIADPQALSALVASQDEVPEVFRRLMARTLAKAGAIVPPKDPEDVPPLRSRPRVRPGDLYELGEHRVLCADARFAEAIARLVGTAKARLLVTDPPFGVSYVGKTARAFACKAMRPRRPRGCFTTRSQRLARPLPLAPRSTCSRPRGQPW